MVADNKGLITLQSKTAECKIALFGGNILSYRPRGEEHDVFWLGDLNKFDNVQAIRGGVPVCWPRFAEEALNNNLPRHGFARLIKWELQKANVDEDKIEAELTLPIEAKYNLNLELKLGAKITDKLEYTLETTNLGNEEFDFSEALHAYYNISSIDDVVIKGLSGHDYKNSLDGKIYTLNNDLQIKGEFDSIFLNQTQPVQIVDEGFKRIIEIKKQGSNNTVVWNPAKDLAEMSAGQYKKFVCVEAANVGKNFVKLPPKQKHIISAVVSIEKFK